MSEPESPKQNSRPRSSLTKSQRQMYALEKTENFRWIATILAKSSNYPLTSEDLTDVELQVELAEIGQYAEVAHGKLPLEFIWKNMERLLQPNFPLQRYDALRGSELILPLRGTLGGFQGYIARQSKKLIVAFSGTSGPVQSLNNLDIRLVAHPIGEECCVHGGFWRIYSGIRDKALDGLVDALKQPDLEQLIFTGHSLGSAICYLLALDALRDKRVQDILSSKPVTLTVAVFGSPRIGNLALAQHWRDLADRGPSIQEYSVKGYNDGVPLIPPQSLGFRHFARTPLYFVEGCLYHIQESESEYSYFTVEDGAAEKHRGRFLDHPLGGHNYYNCRDMERVQRTMQLLYPGPSGEADWDGYLERLGANGELPVEMTDVTG